MLAHIRNTSKLESTAARGDLSFDKMHPTTAIGLFASTGAYELSSTTADMNIVGAGTAAVHTDRASGTSTAIWLARDRLTTATFARDCCWTVIPHVGVFELQPCKDASGCTTCPLTYPQTDWDTWDQRVVIHRHIHVCVYSTTMTPEQRTRYCPDGTSAHGLVTVSGREYVMVWLLKSISDSDHVEQRVVLVPHISGMYHVSGVVATRDYLVGVVDNLDYLTFHTANLNTVNPQNASREVSYGAEHVYADSNGDVIAVIPEHTRTYELLGKQCVDVDPAHLINVVRDRLYQSAPFWYDAVERADLLRHGPTIAWLRDQCARACTCPHGCEHASERRYRHIMAPGAIVACDHRCAGRHIGKVAPLLRLRGRDRSGLDEWLCIGADGAYTLQFQWR